MQCPRCQQENPPGARFCLAHVGISPQGRAPAPPHPSSAPSGLHGEALSALIRPAHLPIDGGGVPA